MKRLMFLVLFLIVDASFAKLIITGPKADSFIDRNSVINISGVTDEDGLVDLSVYNPTLRSVYVLGSVAPIDGFFFYAFNSSLINSSGYYVIASSVLDKGSVFVNSRNVLLLDLFVNDSFARADTVVVNGLVSSGDFYALPERVPFVVNCSSVLHAGFMDLIGDSYTGYYSIPLNASLSCSVFVNYSSPSLIVMSDSESFSVSSANVSLHLLGDSIYSMGLSNVSLDVFYGNGFVFNGSVSALITSPSKESYNVVLGCSDGLYSGEFFFDEPGVWLVDFLADEYGNSGFLNASLMVSDELSVRVINSSFIESGVSSLIVNVDGFSALDAVSFNLSGVPVSLLRSERLLNGFYRLLVNSSLPAGVYSLVINAFDDRGNEGFVDYSLGVNDVILSSCLNNVCTNSSVSVSFSGAGIVRGSVLFSNGLPINASVDVFVNGVLSSSLVTDSLGMFYSSVSGAIESVLVIARYGGVVRSNSFIIDSGFVNNSVSIPSVFTVSSDISLLPVVFFNDGVSKVSAGFSKDFPSWVIPSLDVVVSGNSFVNSSLFINTSGLPAGVYPLVVNGFIGDASFSRSVFIVVERERYPEFGNLTVDNVGFDFNRSMLVVHIVNSDAFSHEVIVNNSGNISSLMISAFNESSVLIPFNELSNGLGFVDGDNTIFDLSPDVLKSFNNGTVSSGASSLPVSFVLVLLGVGMLVSITGLRFYRFSVSRR